MASMSPGRIGLTLPLLAIAAGAVTLVHGRSDEGKKPASPVFGVTIPDGYRAWHLIAPALEGEPLNELRAVVGNEVAVRAYQRGELPFPDGTILVKLAWTHVPSPDFAPATVPSSATTVQVMVKDAARYPATAGWGFGRFIDGQPVDEEQHRTCFACHASRVKDRDYVFTRYAH
jgi:hypothetical protein